MIEARGVEIRHGAHPPVLEDVNLVLSAGERVDLFGRSGTGKSSLLTTLAGLVSPAAGAVEVDGEPAARRSGRRRVASRIGLLFQNPETQILASRVADEIAFGLEQLGWPTPRIRARVAEVAGELDLGAYLGRSPRTLSGGEMQRVALAAALAPAPGHLLLDEPFAHLDSEAAAEIGAWIERGAEKQRALVVTAAPGPPALARGRVGGNGSRRRIVLAAGRVAHDREGPLPPALEAHLAGSTDLDASPGPEQLAALAPRGPQTVLRARGLAAGWAGQAIVNGVDLELRPGEIVTLAGRNGAGKSTLLATLAGLVPPVAGKVEMAPAAALRECVSCVLQFADRLFYRARVRSELEEWAPPPAVAAALAVVGLSPAILEASPFRLSGGEARRLAIAAQIATRRPVLLLDEPGVGLDGPGLMMLAGLIRALAGAGQAVLVATHDPDLARLGSIRLELADGLLSSGR